MLIRGRGQNRWRMLLSVAVVCLWLVFGAAGVTAKAAMCFSVPVVGVMVEVTSDWGPGVGGGGAGAFCPLALVIEGGVGGVEVLSFVRCSRCEIGVSPNPVADQGPIDQGMVEGNAVGGDGAAAGGVRRRRVVRSRKFMSGCVDGPGGAERLRDVS